MTRGKGDAPSLQSLCNSPASCAPLSASRGSSCWPRSQCTNTHSVDVICWTRSVPANSLSLSLSLSRFSCRLSSLASLIRWRVLMRHSTPCYRPWDLIPLVMRHARSYIRFRSCNRWLRVTLTSSTPILYHNLEPPPPPPPARAPPPPSVVIPVPVSLLIPGPVPVLVPVPVAFPSFQFLGPVSPLRTVCLYRRRACGYVCVCCVCICECKCTYTRSFLEFIRNQRTRARLRPEGEAKRKVALVGKGLTFDSGGYNIKVLFLLFLLG